MKNAVKVFKEIGVSIRWSDLEAVKFHLNNGHNFDNSWNLFSVSLKYVNVSLANIVWVLSILLSLKLRAVGE